jgi:mono/diheme cytochrome c family protein
MRRKGVRIWCVFLFLVIALAACLPTLGETVMPNPPTAPPPSTALPVVAVVPPPIPHTVEEARQDCLLCHAMGAVEASPIPDDANHEDAAELCRTCHALLPQPVPPSVAPPSISHDLVGREDCLMCHKMGIAFAPRIPENHTGLPVEVCQTCHQAAAPAAPPPEETREAGVMPSQVPHPIEGREDCRLCHETGTGGAPQFPPDHVDRANEVCSVCHAAASQPTEAPVSPTEEPTTAPTEAPSAASDATKGVTLYATHCAACHGDQGQGTAIAKEPLNSATFLVSRSDEDLRQAIADGVPGTTMPSYSNKLSSKDIADIIALFRSWQ